MGVGRRRQWRWRHAYVGFLRLRGRAADVGRHGVILRHIMRRRSRRRPGSGSSGDALRGGGSGSGGGGPSKDRRGSCAPSGGIMPITPSGLAGTKRLTALIAPLRASITTRIRISRESMARSTYVVPLRCGSPSGVKPASRTILLISKGCIRPNVGAGATVDAGSARPGRRLTGDNIEISRLPRILLPLRP